MIAGNYQKHLKVLGKCAYLYDNATSQGDNEDDFISVFMQQVAAQQSSVINAAFNTSFGALLRSVNVGARSQVTLARAMTEAYLAQSTISTDMTTTPSSSAAIDVLEALQTEMAAGQDNKTLTTAGSTGLVNFFDTWSPTGSWNTSGTPDYADSTYVVNTYVS